LLEFWEIVGVGSLLVLVLHLICCAWFMYIPWDVCGTVFMYRCLGACVASSVLCEVVYSRRLEPTDMLFD